LVYFLSFAISQTLNVRWVLLFFYGMIEIFLLVGRVLVSRTDNAGSTVSLRRTVLELGLIQILKGVNL